MTCNICSHETTPLFQCLVLEKHLVQYHACPVCKFIQTESPYWLEESYDSAITSLDIGLVHRNIRFADIVDKILLPDFSTHHQYLDYGGGYGLFTRLMRDKGYNFFRQDLYCENIFAKHFDIQDAPEKAYHFITAFEVFEHLENPKNTLAQLFSLTDSILFSTELRPDNQICTANDWWYISPEISQHISLFSKESLGILAQIHDAYLYTNNHDLHILTKRKLSKQQTKHLYTKKITIEKIANKLFGKGKKSLLLHDYGLIKNKLFNK